MPPFSRRAWGLSILAATLLVPLEGTGEAAALAPSGGQQDFIAASTPRAKRRRVRRPPPGGVYSRHAAIMDPATGEVLFQKDGERQVPIASITKLMTAIVLLELEPDLAQMATVSRADRLGGGRTQLQIGEKVALGDLLHMSLMCSDNVATRTLVRESGLSSEAFLGRMNARAAELGLAQTRFVEFTGLDPGNVASATDVARLLRAATDNDLIREISTKRSYDFKTRLAWHTIPNTNRLLHGRYEIRGGKTGFISLAGYCLVTWVHTQGRDMIAVVLGAPTNATRFADVMRLVQRAMREDGATKPG